MPPSDVGEPAGAPDPRRRSTSASPAGGAQTAAPFPAAGARTAESAPALEGSRLSRAVAHTFESLRNRHFRFLWAGSMLGMGGFTMHLYGTIFELIFSIAYFGVRL